MPNQKRWYAQVAGVFLLWVEEVVPDDPDGPPWKGNVLRRFQNVLIETPEGPREGKELWQSGPFFARSKKIAMDSAVETIGNSFADYKNFLKSPLWAESEVSEEKWDAACYRFVRGKDFELP